MIKVILDNDILDSILKIEKNKDAINLVNIPIFLSNRFRKNTKKKAHMLLIRLKGIL